VIVSRCIAREWRVDVDERNGMFIMAAELPGIDASQIHVEVDSRCVSIRACPIRRAEPRRYQRRERHSRAFERQIPLPADIIRKNVAATFRNGVLVLDLGQRINKGIDRSRRVAISSHAREVLRVEGDERELRVIS